MYLGVSVMYPFPIRIGCQLSDQTEVSVLPRLGQPHRLIRMSEFVVISFLHFADEFCHLEGTAKCGQVVS